MASEGDLEEECSCYLPTEGEQTLLKSSGQISSSSSALSFKDYNLHGHSSSWQDAWGQCIPHQGLGSVRLIALICQLLLIGAVAYLVCSDIHT